MAFSKSFYRTDLTGILNVYNHDSIHTVIYRTDQLENISTAFENRKR